MSKLELDKAPPYQGRTQITVFVADVGKRPRDAESNPKLSLVLSRCFEDSGTFRKRFDARDDPITTSTARTRPRFVFR